MSFSIPAIQTTDLTAAAISTQVWADKEVIGTWKSVQETIDINPPILNTLHEILNEEGGVRLIAISILQTNTPTDPEEIDLIITLDGVPHLYDGSAIDTMANNTEYSPFFLMSDPTSAGFYLQMGAIAGLGYQQKLLHSMAGTDTDKWVEAHDMKVEIRQTSPIEIGARIRVKVTYEVLETV